MKNQILYIGTRFLSILAFGMILSLLPVSGIAQTGADGNIRIHGDFAYTLTAEEYTGWAVAANYQQFTCRHCHKTITTQLFRRPDGSTVTLCGIPDCPKGPAGKHEAMDKAFNLDGTPAGDQVADQGTNPQVKNNNGSGAGSGEQNKQEITDHSPQRFIIILPDGTWKYSDDAPLADASSTGFSNPEKDTAQNDPVPEIPDGKDKTDGSEDQQRAKPESRGGEKQAAFSIDSIVLKENITLFYSAPDLTSVACYKAHIRITGMGKTAVNTDETFHLLLSPYQNYFVYLPVDMPDLKSKEDYEISLVIEDMTGNKIKSFSSGLVNVKNGSYYSDFN